MKDGLKKHIQKDNHTEFSWSYCGKIFRNTNEVESHMHEAFELTCHECTSKDEVKRYKEDIVVEKEELIMKKMENRKKIRN